MATPDQILAVQDAIEKDAESRGWTELNIMGRIDAGNRVERVIATYWRQRANDTILLVNTSEAGSSRGMDAVYARMKALADEWDARADALDREDEIDAVRRARNGVIRRV